MHKKKKLSNLVANDCCSSRGWQGRIILRYKTLCRKIQIKIKKNFIKLLDLPVFGNLKRLVVVKRGRSWPELKCCRSDKYEKLKLKLIEIQLNFNIKRNCTKPLCSS